MLRKFYVLYPNHLHLFQLMHKKVERVATYIEGELMRSSSKVEGENQVDLAPEENSVNHGKTDRPVINKWFVDTRKEH